MNPLCFVLMPFGKKTDPATGMLIDFDAVYHEVIRPGIADAGLEPLRADEEMTGGIIHKPMFERLILCEFAVADLTSASANVFYELGVRHAVRPASTVLLFADGGRLPFDVQMLRAIPYGLSTNGVPSDANAARHSLATRLKEARRVAKEHPQSLADSPIFQLVENFPDIQRLKTDVFRERVEYAKKQKEQLAAARRGGLVELIAIEKSLDNLADAESGVLIDLFLSYRAVKGWQQMVDLASRMPKPLAATVMVQEQLALALNRLGRADEAERILESLLANRGPSSETYGILGRIYKDRWSGAEEGSFLARGYLQKAIDTYLKGFEADPRDAYPGVNAVTLMELRDPPDERRHDVLPVVRYAVMRRIASGQADYWDFATLLELAILALDEGRATDALIKALPAVREKWEPETTLNNLRLIRNVRRQRGENEPAWVTTVVAELERAAK